MNEHEHNELEQAERNQSAAPETVSQDTMEFSLDDIMREFGGEAEIEVRETTADEILKAALVEAGVVLPEEMPGAEPQPEQVPEREQEESEVPGDTIKFTPVPEEKPEASMDDTVRLDLDDSVAMEDTRAFAPVTDAEQAASGDTIRLETVNELGDTVRLDEEDTQAVRQAAAEAEKPQEDFAEGWEPEYDPPLGEYVPPEPIVFQPRSRLRELKRKLVAGPEKRYYELVEIGLGKLQAAIFLSFVIVLLSVGALVLRGLGFVQPDRMRLLVFGQVLGMLVAALLGSYQMMAGIGAMFRGRFNNDSMLLLTFIACCADSVVCLQQQRVPYCAAFCLEVTMSLWAEYQRRNTEMGMMDTMRKATRLHSVVKVPDFFDGRAGFLRGEGQVEDFMEHYAEVSGPQKVQSRFLGVAALAAVAVGAAGTVFNGWQEGVRLCAAAMLAAVPATSFISLTRPMAVLERRLHRVGAVLCGWKGVRAMCGPATVPVSDRDLFPGGSVKMNGVKFFGSLDPDQVIAYATAVITAEGTGLTELFNQLLDSRNGRHYDAENFRVYNGGIGAEVDGEPVLVGTHSFLREMGVEVPEGTRVHQAIYVAVDGELGGVFALTYGKVRSSVAGLSALCGYRSLTPVLTCGDFMVTESFLRSKFGVNTRRIAFPGYAVRKELEQQTPVEDAKVLAMFTREELSSFAFLITGARALRTASIFGVTIHMIAGILGLVIVALLLLVNAGALLTAENLMLFELIWLVPGLLITEWTRNA